LECFGHHGDLAIIDGAIDQTGLDNETHDIGNQVFMLTKAGIVQSLPNSDAHRLQLGVCFPVENLSGANRISRSC